MSSKELYAIIKACGDAKITKLKFHDLYLEFGNNPGQVVNATPPTATEIAEQEKKSFLQDEMSLKQEQLDLMLLENPEQYEDLMTRGDLVDGANSG